MQTLVDFPAQPIVATSFSANGWNGGDGASREVVSPYTGALLGRILDASDEDVRQTLTGASKAFEAWRHVPLKERCSVLLKCRELLLNQIEVLANSAAREAGKTLAEGRAEVLKGVEVLEFAASLQNLDQGGVMEVSRGVTCEYRREPLGVVVGITPFNFPAMVPMWMIPIALALGNVFVLKPSDKVPFTPCLLAQIFSDAGLPPGVFSILQGGKEVVDTLVSDPHVAAIGFVGSSSVAQRVYQRATGAGKRALCLGGAKNHLIVVPDAEPVVAIDGIVSSFTGCAGQRCMATSVLVAVGDVDHILEGVVERAQNMKLGADMGALIDKAASERLRSAISRAESQGAVVRLDGRKSAPPNGYEGGFWLGPTILDNVNTTMECSCTELFGPVLSVVRVTTLEEALALDSQSRYGNATSIFTSSGGVARMVANRSSSGMIGVNIGVPVPREPFSFGGTKESKFGHGDITGQGGVEFWSTMKKITSKWSLQSDKNWMS